MSEKVKRRIVISAVAVCSALVAAGFAGFSAKRAGRGFCALAIVAGLLPGLAMLGFSRVKASERIGIAIGAAILGLLVFGWVSYLPAWRAETALASGDLENMCVRITAMRICGERKMMGVFDPADVPPEIFTEAERRVSTMPREEKLAMCNKTFGKRINSGAKKAGNMGAMLTGVLWVALALAAAAGPAVLRDRLAGL